MAEYPINKGIGRPVEFKGLKAQYLFIFCGGLLALFVLFVILYMVGIDQWICIGFGAASSSVLVWQTFALNARYGEHGLMKLGAVRRNQTHCFPLAFQLNSHMKRLLKVLMLALVLALPLEGLARTYKADRKSVV